MKALRISCSLHCGNNNRREPGRVPSRGTRPFRGITRIARLEIGSFHTLRHLQTPLFAYVGSTHGSGRPLQDQQHMYGEVEEEGAGLSLTEEHNTSFLSVVVVGTSLMAFGLLMPRYMMSLYHLYTTTPAPAPAASSISQEYYQRIHTYYSLRSAFDRTSLMDMDVTAEVPTEIPTSHAVRHAAGSSSLPAIAGVSLSSVGSSTLYHFSPIGRPGSPFSFVVVLSIATFLLLAIKILLQTVRQQMKQRELMVEATEGLDISLMDVQPLYAVAGTPEISWPEVKVDIEGPKPLGMSFRSLWRGQQQTSGFSNPEPAEPAEPAEPTEAIAVPVLDSLKARFLGQGHSSVTLQEEKPINGPDDDLQEKGVVDEEKVHIHLPLPSQNQHGQSQPEKHNPGEPMILLMGVMSMVWDGVVQATSGTTSSGRTFTVITDGFVDSSSSSPPYPGKPLMYRTNQKKISLTKEKKAKKKGLKYLNAVDDIVHGLLYQAAPRRGQREKFDPIGHLLDAKPKARSHSKADAEPYDAFGNVIKSLSSEADRLTELHRMQESRTPLSALVDWANEDVAVMKYPYCPVSQLLTDPDWLVSDWAGIGGSESTAAGKYDPVAVWIREWANVSDSSSTTTALNPYDPIGHLLALEPPGSRNLNQQLPVKYDPISNLLKAAYQPAERIESGNKYDPIGCILAKVDDIKAPSLDDNGAAWDPVWWLLRGWAGNWKKDLAVE